MQQVNASDERNTVLKPEAIHHYNQHMGGVDKVDQQMYNFQSLQKIYMSGSIGS